MSRAACTCQDVSAKSVKLSQLEPGPDTFQYQGAISLAAFEQCPTVHDTSTVFLVNRRSFLQYEFQYRNVDNDLFGGNQAGLFVTLKLNNDALIDTNKEVG